MLVFIRPHVRTLRRRNPTYSRLKVLWLVIKSGGDNNSLGQRRSQRRTNRQGDQIYLQRLQRDHIERMRSIRTRNNYADLSCSDSDASDSELVDVDEIERQETK